MLNETTREFYLAPRISTCVLKQKKSILFEGSFGVARGRDERWDEENDILEF